jgi:hypothetical protein
MVFKFNAAKDFVYESNGGYISSGGYRISKILNGKSKKKGKQVQTQEGGEGGEGGERGQGRCSGDDSNIFNEDSGIPIGLLLLQRIHQYEPNHKQNNQDAQHHVNATTLNSNSTNNLVYASIMAESDSGSDDKNENIELVITPSKIGNACENGYSCYSENPIEISSNQIDDELYNFLVKNVSGLDDHTIIKKITPLRKTTTTKKKQQQQRFGKHNYVEKIFQRNTTKSKRQRQRD